MLPTCRHYRKKFVKKMEKTCIICKSDGKYKCPTCLVFYCSVQCCKRHREKGCDVWVKNDEKTLVETASKPRYTTADTVPVEKLMLLSKLIDLGCDVVTAVTTPSIKSLEVAKVTILGNDESLKYILDNPHLRELLVTINNSKEPEKIMQVAMQEPLFLEFADACLRLVEPPRSN